MTRKRTQVGGYTWKREMTRAITTNNAARSAVQAIHEHVTNSPVISALLISQLTANAALALADNADAIRELNEIAERTDP
jgi:hypothetical protein